MKTRIEIGISDPVKRPKVTRDSGGHWSVTFEIFQHNMHTRGVWVKTFDAGTDTPKDGKGFLVGPTRRLTVG